MIGRPALVALPLVLTGCGAETGDLARWEHLARGHVPDRSARLSFEAPDGREVRLVPDGGHLRIETELVRADWVYKAGLDAWAAVVDIRPHGKAPAGVEEQRLTGESDSFRYFPPREMKASGGVVPSDSFLFTGTGCFLRLDAGSEPPERLNLSLYTGRGRERDGVWLDEGRRFSGESLSVWPGEGVSLGERELEARTLRFATTLEPALAPLEGSGLGEVVFRIRAGDRVVFEYRLEDGVEEDYRWHEVDFGPDAQRSELSFEVEGGMAYTAFHAPVLGPEDIGDYRERPWGEDRPDIVLFLADTFRADNLRAYGAEHDLTPHLDRAARDGWLWERAWSVSTYTFPSHASLFAGLYPHQLGAVGTGRALPDAASSVVEAMAREGYRTGAITDSAMVSRNYGLDQGFEWFDERLIDLDSTLERARDFLDADDGRPVFLFVHTYRTHTPFHASAETLEELRDVLGVESDFETLERARLALNSTDADWREFTAEEEALVERLRRHYLAGVLELDRGFGAWRSELDSRGLLERGYLLFTSDHGEEFGEHGHVYHTGPVWDCELRVPLLAIGGDLEPRRVSHPSSLVDLAPTLAQLSRVAPDPAWVGESLFQLGRPRTLFAFQAWGEPEESTLALIQGGRKVITYEVSQAWQEGRILGAFDLGQDPGEERTEDVPDWAIELLESHAATLEDLFRPRYGSLDARLDGTDLQDLKHLGY